MKRTTQLFVTIKKSPVTKVTNEDSPIFYHYYSHHWGVLSLWSPHWEFSGHWSHRLRIAWSLKSPLRILWSLKSQLWILWALKSPLRNLWALKSPLRILWSLKSPMRILWSLKSPLRILRHWSHHWGCRTDLTNIKFMMSIIPVARAAVRNRTVFLFKEESIRKDTNKKYKQQLHTPNKTSDTSTNRSMTKWKWLSSRNLSQRKACITGSRENGCLHHSILNRTTLFERNLYSVGSTFPFPDLQNCIQLASPVNFTKKIWSIWNLLATGIWGLHHSPSMRASLSDKPMPELVMQLSWLRTVACGGGTSSAESSSSWSQSHHIHHSTYSLISHTHTAIASAALHSHLIGHSTHSQLIGHSTQSSCRSLHT